MHYTALGITRKRHTTKDVSNSAQALLLWLVKEWRHLLLVPGNQQEAFAALRQPPQLATMGCEVQWNGKPSEGAGTTFRY